MQRRADQAAVRIGSRAGQVALRHVGASAAEGRVEGDAVRYPGAMGRGRDLLVAVTTSGFEDSVVLPDAAAGGSWQSQLSFPAALSVRQEGSGVELVDRDGAVVAFYGDGVAFDSSGSEQAPPAHSQVAVRLVSQRPGAALLEVSADPAWLADPARVYPVTVDPVYRSTTLQSNGSTDTCSPTGGFEHTYCDTHASEEAAASSHYTSPWLNVGASAYQRNNIMFLKFPTGGLQSSQLRVVEAHVRLYAFAGEARDYYLHGNSFSPRTDTTWNANRPSGTPYYGLWHIPAGAGWYELPITAAAQSWFNGAAHGGSDNHGVQLRARYSTDYGAFRQFTSMENADGAFKPSLRVTYENRLPVTLPKAPASGTFVCAPPVLSARFEDYLDTGRVDFSVWGPAGHVAYGERAARHTQTVSFQSPAVPGGHYSWHTRGWDGYEVSNPEWGEFWSYFMNTPVVCV